MGQQVTQILEQAFQGMNVELFEMSSGRLSGTIIWDGFDGQEQEVSILLAYTPHEMSAMQAA